MARKKRDIFGDIFRVVGVPILAAGTLIGGTTSTVITTTTTTTTPTTTTPTPTITITTLTPSTNSPSSRSSMVIANEVLNLRPPFGTSTRQEPPYSPYGPPPPPFRGPRVSHNLKNGVF